MEETNENGAKTSRQQLTSTCLVCGSPARPHKHYGAITCYSCRAFFRRNHKTNHKCYERNNGECEISETNRTTCKYCRMKKCLEIGMRPDLVESSSKSNDITHNEQNEVSSQQTLENVEILVQDNENQPEFYIMNPLTQTYERFLPPAARKLDGPDVINDNGNTTNLNENKVNIPKPSDNEKNLELYVEEISSVQEIPENVGALYNQNDEGHRLVYDYLQMQKQISNYTSDNEVPTNYKEIDELMNVSTINEKLSDDDFNIIIREFKSSVIKNAQELKEQAKEKDNIDIDDLFNDVMKEEKKKRVKGKGKKPVSIVRPYSREGTVEETKKKEDGYQSTNSEPLPSLSNNPPPSASPRSTSTPASSVISASSNSENNNSSIINVRQSDNSTTTTFNNLEASYNTTLNLMRQQHEIIRQQELLIIQQRKQLEMQLNILQKHPSGQVQFNYPGTSNALTVQFVSQEQTNAQKELVEKSSEQQQKDEQTNRKQKLNHEKQLMERHECSQQERLRGTENSVDKEVVMAGPTTENDDIDSELEQIQDTSSKSVQSMKRKKPCGAPKFRKFKVPYLEFTVEEEYLVVYMREARNTLGNEEMDYFINYDPHTLYKFNNAFAEIARNQATSWVNYLDCVKDIKKLAMSVVCKHQDDIIPKNFGKFPGTFLSSLLEYSMDNSIQFEQALFFARKNVPDLFTQKMLNHFEPSQSALSFYEQHFPNDRKQAPVDMSDIALFKSPWCSSYEDEEFYMNTLTELGELLCKYPNAVGIAGLMALLVQPKSSPFAKSKSLQRLFKSVATLLNRFILTSNENSRVANEDSEALVNLLLKLPRCVEIFLNKRIEF